MDAEGCILPDPAAGIAEDFLRIFG